MYAVLGLMMIQSFMVLVACNTREREKEIPIGENITQKDVEDMYSMQFLNMVNILRQIKSGNAEILVKEIESSIPVYLKHINTFEDSDLKAVSFYSAEIYYKSSAISPPSGFEIPFQHSREKAGEILSKDCFELLSLCTAPGCTPLPTSLRPVDINRPNVSGWHYIVGSNCGVKWWRFWRPGCGPPLTGLPCQN